MLAAAVALLASPASGAVGTTVRTLAGSTGSGAIGHLGVHVSDLLVHGRTLLIADEVWHVVRQYDPATGRASVFAGTGSDVDTSGSAKEAGLAFPQALAVGRGGAVLVATATGVRQVSTQGAVSTVVTGNGTRKCLPGVGALQVQPVGGLAQGTDGRIYLSQPLRNQVWGIDPDGTCQVVLGLPDGGAPTPALPSVPAGAGPATALASPQGLCLQPDGTLLVSDREHDRVLQLASSGLVTTLATVTRPTRLSCLPGSGALVSGRGAVFWVAATGSVTKVLDHEGAPVQMGDDVFVGGQGLFRVHQGQVSRLTDSLGGFSRLNGGSPASVQTFHPGTVAVSGRSVLWGDRDAHVFRLDGTRVQTVTANEKPFWDAASLDPRQGDLLTGDVTGLAVGSRGTVASFYDMNQVVQLLPRGRRVIAGAGGPCSPGLSAVVLTGTATRVPLCNPLDLAYLGRDLLVADSKNHLVRRLTPDGRFTVFAGTGQDGHSGDGGRADRASMSEPASLAVGPDGSVYISDVTDLTVRRVSPSGVITTVAGTAGRRGYAGDGGLATKALLSDPSGLAVDHAGMLYVADTGNAVIRRVDRTGRISTLAGSVAGFSGEGEPALRARFSCPADLAEDRAQRLLVVADPCNHRVRSVGLG